MRKSIVPRPYALDVADIVAARQLVQDALPLVFALAAVDSSAKLTIENLLKSDYSYLAPHLEAMARSGSSTGDLRRPVQTIRHLAEGAFMSPSALYPRISRLLPHVQASGIALAIVLAARGDFCANTVIAFAALNARVGGEATGPAILGHEQRLFGPTLQSSDMKVPLLLKVPGSRLDGRLLLDEVETIVDQIATVSARRRPVADTAADALDAIGVTAQQLVAYNPLSAVLAPQLEVGPLQLTGFLKMIEFPPGSAQRVTAKHRLRHGAVLETAHRKPSGRREDWIEIDPVDLRDLFAQARGFGFELPGQASHVAYWRRRDSKALYRRLLAAPALSDEDARAAGVHLTYAVDLGGSGTSNLARGIAHCELLATTGGPEDTCLERFARQLTPCLVKATDDGPRGLVRALRVMFNIALVAVGRRREATEIDQRRAF